MVMKKLVVTTVIFVLLLFLSTGIQGQTAQPQLDEVKLIQQFVGTWQMDVGKDSLNLWEVQQYDKAFIGTGYHVFNGKKSFWFVMNWSYYPKEGKSKGYNLYAGGGYQTWIASFDSENKWSASFLRDFNPEVVIGKAESILETPTSCTITYFNVKGEKTGEQKFHKIK